MISNELRGRVYFKICFLRRLAYSRGKNAVKMSVFSARFTSHDRIPLTQRGASVRPEKVAEGAEDIRC